MLAAALGLPQEQSLVAACALQSGMAIKHSFSRHRVAVNAVGDTDTGPGCKSDSGRALLIYVTSDSATTSRIKNWEQGGQEIISPL